ncbi:glycoside hydrolase family 15 protein [Nitrosococcus watsonii]|uniref:Glycoside hydrolase 15-related protein n=1 Tax=Nitrosococcus watsoni (strain C-113) TaxID=105559 RepID=D8K516_NITWC|nr:glycoside hydrolase family 15 protein [Nitrosococcus watsonii]ADJ27993.1 glycoside hydrolase 15-related protein [Nitrosococcus watsonii C-113]
MNRNAYPAISDYGYISDCHSSALISKSGSIDWCCMPRVDSRSCFGRLLGWEQGGYCQIAPPEPYEVSRRYLPQTLILETTFRSSKGEAQLLDCFMLREGGKQHPHRQILRVLEGLKGQVKFCVEIVPRFDYGAIKPWIQRRQDKRSGDYYIVIGGSDGLLISSDFPLEMKDRHNLQGAFYLNEGQRARLSLLYRRPENLDEGWVDIPTIETLDQRLEETFKWWQTWSSQGQFSGPYAEQAHRSAIVLKGLCNAPTGAIAAASTTSLPEAPGGERNWDYRFTWIRDSTFTVRALADLGYIKEADGFRRFLERTAAGCADEVQILFGVGGERRLHEFEIQELPGYRGAKPVRQGNAAETQIQLDVYGELLELAWRWHQRGQTPDEDYWEFLVGLVNAAAEHWRKPDQGLWEMRGEPRHFVHSKVMCWAALDRGIKLAADLDNHAPLAWWEQEREAVRQAVEEKGYDSRQGIFIQAFDHFEMDASLLLLPMVGFVDYQDKRMIRTTNAVWKNLEQEGLLRRYRAENHDDGLKGKEGVFLACSFWLAECLAYQGRLEEAREVFKRAAATGNDLGLYSEEYDTEREEMLGNFPQGLTHLSLIAAAVALTQRAEEEKDR